jgi:hypothetical protein
MSTLFLQTIPIRLRLIFTIILTLRKLLLERYPKDGVVWLVRLLVPRNLKLS